MNKWSIGTRLMTSLMALGACLGLLGLASLLAVNGLRGDLGEMSEKILRKIELSSAIQVNTWTVRAELRATLLAATLKRPQDARKARDNADQAFTRLDAAVEEIRPLLLDEKAKAAAAGIASILPQWKDAFRQVADLAQAGNLEGAYKLRTQKESPLAAQIEEAPTVIAAGTTVTAGEKLASADQSALLNRWIIVGTLAAGLALVDGEHNRFAPEAHAAGRLRLAPPASM